MKLLADNHRSVFYPQLILLCNGKKILWIEIIPFLGHFFIHRHMSHNKKNMVKKYFTIFSILSTYRVSKDSKLYTSAYCPILKNLEKNKISPAVTNVSSVISIIIATHTRTFYTDVCEHTSAYVQRRRALWIYLRYP